MYSLPQTSRYIDSYQSTQLVQQLNLAYTFIRLFPLFKFLFLLARLISPFTPFSNSLLEPHPSPILPSLPHRIQLLKQQPKPTAWPKPVAHEIDSLPIFLFPKTSNHQFVRKTKSPDKNFRKYGGYGWMKKRGLLRHGLSVCHYTLALCTDSNMASSVFLGLNRMEGWSGQRSGFYAWFWIGIERNDEVPCQGFKITPMKSFEVLTKERGRWLDWSRSCLVWNQSFLCRHISQTIITINQL